MPDQHPNIAVHDQASTRAVLKNHEMYPAFVWFDLYNISHLLLFYPHVVQTFSLAPCFQKPVIFTMSKNCKLQGITSLFKLQRNWVMSALASLLVESNESHICVTRWGLRVPQWHWVDKTGDHPDVRNITSWLEVVGVLISLWGSLTKGARKD